MVLQQYSVDPPVSPINLKLFSDLRLLDREKHGRVLYIHLFSFKMIYQTHPKEVFNHFFVYTMQSMLYEGFDRKDIPFFRKK